MICLNINVSINFFANVGKINYWKTYFEKFKYSKTNVSQKLNTERPTHCSNFEEMEEENFFKLLR